MYHKIRYVWKFLDFEQGLSPHSSVLASHFSRSVPPFCATGRPPTPMPTPGDLRRSLPWPSSRPSPATSTHRVCVPFLLRSYGEPYTRTLTLWLFVIESDLISSEYWKKWYRWVDPCPLRGPPLLLFQLIHPLLDYRFVIFVF